MMSERMFGGRLLRAVKAFGPRPRGQPGADGTVIGFHEAIRPLIPRGGGNSRQTLYRIISNRARPSDHFIAATLQVLPQVRRGWLVDGEGEMTDQDAQLAAAGHGALRETAGTGTDLYDRIRSEVPELADLDWAVSAALMTYLHRWVRALIRVGVMIDDDEGHDVEELLAVRARSVFDWMSETFNEWGHYAGSDSLMLNRDGASDFYVAILTALNTATALAVAAFPKSED